MPNPFEKLREKVVFGQAVKVAAKGVQRENLAERRAELEQKKTPEQRQVEKCAKRASSAGGAYGVGFERCRIDSYTQKLVLCQVHELEAKQAKRSVNSFLRCNGDQTGEPDWMKDDASGWRPSGRMSIGFRRIQ